MLDVRIDRQEPTELFEQVAAEIRRERQGCVDCLLLNAGDLA